MADLGLLSDEKKVSSEIRRLTTKEFREGLAEVIAFSTRTRQPLVLTRHGKDQVALVSINDLWLIEALKKVQLRTALDDCESPEMVLAKLREVVAAHLGHSGERSASMRTNEAKNGTEARNRKQNKSPRRSQRGTDQHSTSASGV